MVLKAGNIVVRGSHDESSRESKPATKQSNIINTSIGKIKAGNIIDRSNQAPSDKKIRAEDKNIQNKVSLKKDKKIYSEDKGKNSVESIKINRSSHNSQVKAREILKPSRYVLDLMK